MNSHFSANFLYHDLVLASASPQRAALLREYGFRFLISPADIEETIADGLSPNEIAESIAKAKAAAVAPRFPNAIILSADTIVVSPSGKILGKPQNRDEAKAMIQEKSGSAEQVITGYSLLSEHGLVSGSETSEVIYRHFSPSEIEAVIESNEWQEVAGALRIEGKTMRGLIKTTRGDYHNIIGLPVGKIAQILRDFPLVG